MPVGARSLDGNELVICDSLSNSNGVLLGPFLLFFSIEEERRGDYRKIGCGP
jgi:hypothetical protein